MSRLDRRTFLRLTGPDALALDDTEGLQAEPAAVHTSKPAATSTADVAVIGAMPGWVTFSLDGEYAYASSGEVIHAKTRRILYLLQDENYNTVCSEKMVDIHMQDGKVTKAGDQFGLGRVNVAGD